MSTTEWTVGDRQVAFTVLLPEPRGRVLLAVPAVVEPALLERYADAWAVELRGGRVVRRDDGSAVEPGSADLVVAEGADESPWASVLAEDGTLALLGTRGELRIHPDLEVPEQVWRAGWPLATGAGPARWLRRAVALRLPRRRATRLRVVPGRSSLAADVAADVSRAVGGPHEVVGVLTAGHSVLRLRSAQGDVAVRLTLSRHGVLRDRLDEVLADAPALSELVPTPLAAGTTHGHPWTATRWLPAPGEGGRAWWGATERRADLAARVVATLAAAPTGSTAPGWARRWVEPAVLLSSTERQRVVEALTPLEGDLPTAWCHGDLWPGNLLLGARDGAVIDWDNADREAPAGLDRLLLAVLGPDPVAPVGPGDTVCGQLLSLVPLDGLGEVGGRPWEDWPTDRRTLLALAACVLYLRNRSLLDIGAERLAEEVRVLHGMLQGPAPGDGAVEGEGRRTARGAVWLGASSLVVKTSQTVVLLTLAALLAPEALGLVALGTLVANVSTILANLGTANALVYWRGDVERAARTAVTVALVSGGLLVGGLWLAAPWLAETFRADGGAQVIRGLTVTVPLMAVAYVTGELLRRRLAFVRRILPDVIASLAGTAVAIVLAFSGVGVMSLVAGQVVQGVLTLLIAWIVHPPVLPGWDRDDARGLLTYGGPLSGASLLEVVQLNLDYLFVSRVLGALSLGLYSLAFRLAYLPHVMIVLVVTGAAFPYLCRRRGAELAVAAERVAVTTLTLVLPVCLGIVLFSGHLVLLGPEWAPAVPVAAWLGVYAVLLATGQLAQVTLNAAGRPSWSFGLRLSHLLLLLVALSVSVSHGIVAVAVAQVVAAVGVAVLAGTLVSRKLPTFSLRRLAVGLRGPALAAAAMAGVVLGLQAVVPADRGSLGDLVLRGLLALTTYVVVLVAVDRSVVRDVRVLTGRTS